MKLATHIRTALTLIAVTAILALNTGCSALNSTFMNEAQLGKLYAASDALYQAANNCADEDAQHMASYWSSIAITNVRQQGGYFKVRSPEYNKAIELVNSLALASRNTAAPEESCQLMHQAYTMTNEYIALLTNMPRHVASN